MAAKKNIIILIKQINDITEKFANERLRGKEMTFSQLRVLNYISRCDGNMAAFQDIEKYFLIAQPTVVGILKRLEIKGFVTTCTDDTDRRFKNVLLTEKGVAFCREVNQDQQVMIQQLTKNLSPEEAAELYRLLMEIYINLVQ